MQETAPLISKAFLVTQEMPNSHFGLALLDCLLDYLVITARIIENLTGASYFAANKTAQRFKELGLLTEVTGRERDRVYQYDFYLALFAAANAPEEFPEADL